MGNNADDRITNKSLKTLAGNRFRYAGSKEMEALIDRADDLAARDGMPLSESIQIVSGAKLKPYGSPRI